MQGFQYVHSSRSSFLTILEEQHFL